jgi:hypothetical protein
MKNLSIILLISYTIISCTPTIKNLSQYNKLPMLRSELINKNEIDKNVASVVVLNVHNKNNNTDKNSNLGKNISTYIENILVSNKLAELQDRNAFEKLEEEILIAEMSTESLTYQGPAKADFAIAGEISEASFNHKFIAAKYGYDNNTSLPYRIPPKHQYTANFSGNIKIYQLPDLKVRDIIPLQAQSVIFEDALEQQSWLVNRKIDTSTLKKENDSLVKEAAIKAINKKQHILKNIFSNYRKGYILEKRYNGKNHIFKLSIGKNFSLKHGQKVKIFQATETTNPLTEEKIIEKNQIGTGVISNIINEKTAWIIVKDKNIADKLRLGDFVTVIYSRSLNSYF